MQGPIGGERALLLLPGTYMNELGRAVAEAVQFYKLAPGDITVFHDEIELPPGKVRVKVGGGSAGHNGLRSISEHVGNDYRRVRIGVDHPGHKESGGALRAERFRQERVAVGRGVDRGHRRRCVELLVRGQDASFQNKVHLAMAAKGFGEEPDGDSRPDQRSDKA